MQKIKRRIFYFFRKHYKIYTWIILVIGIVIGCGYDGRGDLGEIYYKIGNQLYYIGVMK